VAIGRLPHQLVQFVGGDAHAPVITGQRYNDQDRPPPNEDGKAVLVVSSYLPELFELCDRIAVMNRGRLSPARPVSEWTPESVLEVAISAAPPMA
jgi:ribose transport system ATP-binding protein